MTSAKKIVIRAATIDDIPDLLKLITELADYEKLSHELEVTPNSLQETYFGKRIFAYAILAFQGGNSIGYASYFFNYSTFKGRPGLYLEDLFVMEEFRGTGTGYQLMAEIIAIAKENRCAWIEGLVLNWNKNAMNFYTRFHAESHPEWVQYILPEDRFTSPPK